MSLLRMKKTKVEELINLSKASADFPDTIAENTVITLIFLKRAIIPETHCMR
jgi:hypothetical protein